MNGDLWLRLISSHHCQFVPTPTHASPPRFTGSIVALASNSEINSVADIVDKRVGAQAISDFAGAQVQFYMLLLNGLDYIMVRPAKAFMQCDRNCRLMNNNCCYRTPNRSSLRVRGGVRQVAPAVPCQSTDTALCMFLSTENQEDTVNGVLDGRWDVGFVRTGQIERMKDEDGEYLDPDLFKVLDPKIYVMDNGDLFPFLHSTPVFPEWPLFAKQDVDRMVSEEIQLALVNFEYHKMAGDLIHSCRQDYAEQICGNMTTTCEELEDLCKNAPPRFFDKKARCDTTRELAELAREAGVAGRHNGFRPARSHFSLRTMQQTAGFLMQNELGE